MNDEERKAKGLATRREVLGDAHVDRAEANKAAGFLGWGADSDVPLGDGSGAWQANLAANMGSDYDEGENFFSVFSSMDCRAMSTPLFRVEICGW